MKKNYIEPSQKVVEIKIKHLLMSSDPYPGRLGYQPMDKDENYA